MAAELLIGLRGRPHGAVSRHGEDDSETAFARATPTAHALSMRRSSGCRELRSAEIGEGFRPESELATEARTLLASESELTHLRA